MSAPPGAVTVGNDVTSATIRSGTSSPSMDVGTTEPMTVPFVSMNAPVAMAGIVVTRAAEGRSTRFAGIAVAGGVATPPVVSCP